MKTETGRTDVKMQKELKHLFHFPQNKMLWKQLLPNRLIKPDYSQSFNAVNPTPASGFSRLAFYDQGG